MFLFFFFLNWFGFVFFLVKEVNVSDSWFPLQYFNCKVIKLIFPNYRTISKAMIKYIFLIKHVIYHILDSLTTHWLVNLLLSQIHNEDNKRKHNVVKLLNRTFLNKEKLKDHIKLLIQVQVWLRPVQSPLILFHTSLEISS